MAATNITDIAFEQISGDYHWGSYGEFRVVINVKTGYINATHLCKLADGKEGNKKDFRDWRKNASTDELIYEVSSSGGIPPDDLFKVTTGGQVLEIRGTYVHPDLIPHVASWASPKFAIKVSRIVNAHLVREYTESIKQKELVIVYQKNKIDELMVKVDAQTEKIDKLLNKNDELLDLAKEAKEDAEQAREERTLMAEELDVITIETKETSVKLETVHAEGAAVPL